MAKVTMQMASPDSPIYNGKFVISSPKSSPESKQSSQPSTDGQEVDPSAPLDLQNLSFDPAEALYEACKKAHEREEAAKSSEEKTQDKG